MTLTAHQKSAALRMSRLADKGDPKAKAFFAKIQAENPALWEDYNKLLTEGDEKIGGPKRSEVAVDSSILSQKQFAIAVNMANKARKGVMEAVNFFAAQDDQASRGNAVSKVFCAIRDEILARPESTPDVPIPPTPQRGAPMPQPTAQVHATPPAQPSPVAVPASPEIPPTVIGQVVHDQPLQK